MHRDFIKKHSDIIGGAFFLLLTFVIIARIIFPVFSSISELRENISTQELKNQELQETYSAIQSINNPNIQKNLSLTRSALPQNKDIIQIYTTVLDVADKLNLELAGFSVNAGQVYDAKNPNKEEDAATPEELLPTISVQVKVSGGNTDNLVTFANQLTNVLPLAKVGDIKNEESEGAYQISFYYKPLNVELLSSQEVVKPLSASEQQLLQQLQQMKDN